MAVDYTYYQRRLKKCILFLGPEFPFIANAQERQAAVTEAFGERIHFKYWEDDDFFQFQGNRDRNRAAMALEDMFEDMPLHTAYEQLAQLPFPLVVSLSPDWFLRTAMEQQYGARALTTLAYQKDTPLQLDHLPSAERPVLLNLFGDITNEDSLILDFDNLFDFFSTLFSVGLPDQIGGRLKSATDFIFLGFKHEAWYLKLLLRLLNVQQKTNLSLLDPGNKDHPVLLFYREHFEFEYPDVSTTAFLQNLYRAVEANGGLREISTYANLKLQLEDLMSKHRVAEVLELLKKEDDISRSDLVNFEMRYNIFRQREQLGQQNRLDPDYITYTMLLTDYINDNLSD